MIPVFQTKTLANDGHGDCFNACIASLLEIPLREAAGISSRLESGAWHRAWRDWLAERGWRLVGHFPEDELFEATDASPKGFSIASGRSERLYPEGHRLAGERIHHAVIAFDGVVVHDPFPIPGGFGQIYLYETLEPVEAERVAA